MNDRFNALWSEMRMRRKAIARVWGPDVSFMHAHGGFFWDRAQPSVVLVCIGGEDKHSVNYDEEMTLLARAIDEEMRKMSNRPPLGTNPAPLDGSLKDIVNMNHAIIMLVGAACDDKLWAEDFVQDAHARMFNRNPLDRIVEAVGD